jgi:hypothetical protein
MRNARNCADLTYDYYCCDTYVQASVVDILNKFLLIFRFLILRIQ